MLGIETHDRQLYPGFRGVLELQGFPAKFGCVFKSPVVHPEFGHVRKAESDYLAAGNRDSGNIVRIPRFHSPCKATRKAVARGFIARQLGWFRAVSGLR